MRGRGLARFGPYEIRSESGQQLLKLVEHPRPAHGKCQNINPGAVVQQVSQLAPMRRRPTWQAFVGHVSTCSEGMFSNFAQLVVDTCQSDNTNMSLKIARRSSLNKIYPGNMLIPPAGSKNDTRQKFPPPRRPTHAPGGAGWGKHQPLMCSPTTQRFELFIRKTHLP